MTLLRKAYGGQAIDTLAHEVSRTHQTADRGSSHIPITDPMRLAVGGCSEGAKDSKGLERHANKPLMRMRCGIAPLPDRDTAPNTFSKSPDNEDAQEILAAQTTT